MLMQTSCQTDGMGLHLSDPSEISYDVENMSKVNG